MENNSVKVLNHRILEINGELYIPIAELSSWKIYHKIEKEENFGESKDGTYQGTLYLDILLKNGISYTRLKIFDSASYVIDHITNGEYDNMLYGDEVGKNIQLDMYSIEFRNRDLYHKANIEARNEIHEEIIAAKKELVQDFTNANSEYLKDVQTQAFQLLMANKMIQNNIK